MMVIIIQSSLFVNRLDMFTFADCSPFLLVLSSSDSIRRCMVSNAVKLMLNAIGPIPSSGRSLSFASSSV